VIFRRRSKQPRESDQPTESTVEGLDADAGEAEAGAAAEGGSAVDEASAERPRGPWDRAETDRDAEDSGYIDLGGLLVKGAPGTELRLQVDEKTSVVAAVMLAGPQSGLELRAFAAPRREGIWDDVRKDIAAEAGKRGGTATEIDGEFGTELRIVVPVRTPEGKQGSQTSRVVGVEGPRWLLRGTFLGKSAVDPDPDGVVESAFRDVIVVRGDGPMAPRDLIPLTMPAEIEAARDAAEQEADGTSPDQDDAGSSDAETR
jgi:Protein of unknown function (DUF3710)